MKRPIRIQLFSHTVKLCWKVTFFSLLSHENGALTFGPHQITHGFPTNFLEMKMGKLRALERNLSVATS